MYRIQSRFCLNTGGTSRIATKWVCLKDLNKEIYTDLEAAIIAAQTWTRMQHNEYRIVDLKNHKIYYI